VVDETIEHEFSQAINYFHSGNLQGAMDICRNILSNKPQHPDSLHLLGVIIFRTGKISEAEKLIGQAIALNPENPFFYYNLADVHEAGNKLEEAALSYSRAISLMPTFLEAHNNLANILTRQRKYKEAVDCYNRLLKLKPDFAEAHNNLGNLLKAAGNGELAITSFKNAINYQPDFPQPYNNLANLYKARENFTAAIEYYKIALKVKPDYSDAWNNLGNTYKTTGLLAEALDAHKSAIKFQPDNYRYYLGLGNDYKYLELYDQAVSAYKKAVTLRPHCYEAFINLGRCYSDSGQYGESIHYYKKSLKEKAGHPDSLAGLFLCLANVCAWDDLAEYSCQIDEQTRNAIKNNEKPAESPFVNIFHCSDPMKNYQVARAWSLDSEKKVSSYKKKFIFTDRLDHSKKIRLGYLSSDFRNHVMGHLLKNIFALHDRQFFEVYCYSTGKNDNSIFRESIVNGCDKFRDLEKSDNIEVGQCIYDDQVDILIDIMGFTKGSLLEVAAMRPAPVQALWLGFLGTSGADYFDYLITDRIMTPEEDLSFCSEKPAYLPDTVLVNSYQRKSEIIICREDYHVNDENLIFSSFNNTYKINLEIFTVWMRILKRVQGSVLWLQNKSELFRKNLEKQAERQGVDPQRLMFLDIVSLEEHLARLELVDISLDTIAYNGGATTSHSLWAGVPVITIKGSHMASRISASILTALGMEELILENLDEYEEKAIELAADSEKRSKLRQKIIQNQHTRPLFKTGLFVENLDRLYTEMWNDHMRSK
jgi:protein O-GlcNAc transferase